MSPSTTATPGTEIPRWPKISVTLNADGTGLLTNQGRDHRLNAPDIDAARADVIARVVATARSLERPVRLNSTDPDGEWELAVHPDGTVTELAGKPAPQAPVTRVTPTAAAGAAQTTDAPPQAPPAALTRSQRKWAGESRQRRDGWPAARIAVALALLLCLGAAAALIVTNGPATVVRSPTASPPTAPRAVSPGASVSANDAAEAKAQQRRRARRAAAARERREQRAALIRRVSARQARERRAARRRAAARRAASARRAAARRAANPPPAVSRPRQPAVAPPPPPPPPPPFAPPCGEFDIC